MKSNGPITQLASVRGRLGDVEHVLDGVLGGADQYPVTQVEHMPAGARLLKHRMHRCLDRGIVGKEHHRIDVAL